MSAIETYRRNDDSHLSYKATLDEVSRRALAALRPPPKTSLPAWVEANIVLPGEVSATPGRLKLNPVQRGIAEAISDPNIERVTLVKPVRLGLTTLITSTIASYVANEPSPILAVLPTEQDCRDFVVSDLEPIFENSPALHGLISGEKDESGRNTLLGRRFPGGSLKVVAAKSPRNLRKHNARILLIDEADAMEIGPEGSPILLAERRTLSFANRKIIMGSTPIFEETSHVLRAYRESDQRIFEIKCAECSEYSEPEWSHIRWPEGEPSKAAWCCPKCGSIVEERQKSQMVSDGRWRVTRPEITNHAGFRTSALVSTLANASWANLAREFLAAKSNPDQLQTFVNTLLGQGWRGDAGEEIDPADLSAKVEPFGLNAIPSEVLVITAGIDVQGDRLEVVFVGHGKDNQVFVLGNSCIWGRPEDNETWIECDELLRTTWKHVGGGTLRVDAAAVDAGDGNRTDFVNAFTKPRFNRKIISVKGAAGFSRPLIERSHQKGCLLFIVGVDSAKLRIQNGLTHGSIKLSADLEPRCFEELCSERLETRYSRGQPTRQWTRIPGRRAEILDSLVYAVAARNILTIQMDRRAEELASLAAPRPTMPTMIKSAWLSR